MQLEPIVSPNEQYNMHTFSTLFMYPAAQILQPSTKMSQRIHLFEQKWEQVRTSGSVQARQDGLAHKLQELAYLQDGHPVIQLSQTVPSKYWVIGQAHKQTFKSNGQVQPVQVPM